MKDERCCWLVQAQDFDPDSLRATIPSAVRSVQQALGRGERVYVHCTAGLGRAPGVCIAHIFWFQEKTLDEVCNILVSPLDVPSMLSFYDGPFYQRSAVHTASGHEAGQGTC